MNFDNLGLSAPLLQAIQAQGYTQPTPIQAKAIPLVLAGHDLMAAAQTGTGKTAGFTLPLLHRLSQGNRPKPRQVRALILTPTRELAAQVADSVRLYGQALPLHSAVVFGGVGIQPQISKLARGLDILVATPGRLLDLHQQKAVEFSALEVFILDEADRMLDMGFIHDIRRIIRNLPNKRQNLMFSATFSNEIRTLARSFLNQPEEVSVTPRNETAKTVQQHIHPVDKKQKAALLIHLIQTHQWYQVLVFSKTKHGANKLVKQLDAAGIKSLAIHGNKSQSARTQALAQFKSQKIQVLVATDIAARGLDIEQLPQVVNFDLPNVPEDYVHRIGRTGRAGASGQALSLVSADEIKLLTDIEKVIGNKLKRQLVEGFEPEHDLPEKAPRTPSPPKKTGGTRGRGAPSSRPRGQRPGGGNAPSSRQPRQRRGPRPT